MVEIPVEKKSGVPWWVWLLLAALVIALLIWMLSGNGDDDRARVDTVDTTPAVVVPAAPAANTNPGAQAAAGPITDLAMVTGGANLSGMVGRQVQLSNVQVQEVVGDRTFWVGPNANERALIVLDEQPTPGTPGTEGRYDVTRGQVVNVSGMVRNTNDTAFGNNPIQGLPAGQTAVIRAQSLDIVQRP